MVEQQIRFLASKSSGAVGAILVRPEDAQWLLVLAHGAGAGIRHPFMAGLAQSLANQRIASFRYQFPYMEQGKKAPDPQAILVKTVRSAVAAAHEHRRDLPLLAGGKSLGGRMTSIAISEEELPSVQGIVFFGFPLHAPGKPSSERGEHLLKIRLPMLFLQGTRDTFADLALLRPLCERLRVQESSRLCLIEGADHSFHVPKRSVKTDEEILMDLGSLVADWASNMGYKAG
jgi:uncharacterized protein